MCKVIFRLRNQENVVKNFFYNLFETMGMINLKSYVLNKKHDEHILYIENIENQEF